MTSLKRYAKIPYSFEATVWKYNGQAAWYFVSLPLELSAEIREQSIDKEEGWGRLKCEAKLADTMWESSIWYATKEKTYLLPIKADVRKRTNTTEGDRVEVVLYI